MDTLRNRRDIIDRKQLVGTLAALAESKPAGELRAAALEAFRDALGSGQTEIRRRFDADGDGVAAATAQAYLTDQLLISLFEFAAHTVFPEANPTAADRLSLVAVGGYGRSEMAPFSDVDLLFLHPYKPTPRGEQVVEYILYMLWDLSLTVGQSVRSITECVVRAKQDVTIRTNLLEARFVIGDQPLFVEFQQRFAKDVIAGTGPEFISHKLAERDDRHGRMGDSRYVVEPNIKDGKGGLRDLHTLMWIAKYQYQTDAVADLMARGILDKSEANKFRRAHKFLWTVRFHLHYLAGRGEERLTFDTQPTIAEAMHYTDHAGSSGVERFMKHYYLIAKDVGDLTRIICAALEAAHEHRPFLKLPSLGFGRREIEGFQVENGRLSVDDDDLFAREPVQMLALFRVAQEHDHDIHPHALRLITRNLTKIDAKLRADKRANQLFMDCLISRKDPETTLRRMNESGVLGRFIPDFGRVVAQTQHDMYHVYTVDEHTVFAIGILSRIEDGVIADEVPIASEIVHKVVSRRVLYLSVFLHDIAKGRGGDHSEIGARIALKLGPRLGLTREETETTSWLVRYHLAFSNTAFKRDIGDPKTVSDFVDLVQSPERLRLLLVLTVADIRAVGPKVWNGWKGQLLRDLYREAEAMMVGGDNEDRLAARIADAQEQLRARLAHWPAADIDAIIARSYPSYWLAFTPDAHARHAEMMRTADREGATLKIDTKSDKFRAVTEVTIYAPGHHGLFAGVAGAMAVCGASIADARIFTTTDGMALDSFWIQTARGEAFDQPAKLAKLVSTIERTLSSDYRPERELAGPQPLPPRAAVFRVAPRVLIDNKASATHTVIEVNALDRTGLLYDITRTLVDLRLSVGAARINTYGERAVDVFYVKDMFGMQITHPARLEQIRAALLAALNPAPATEPVPAASAAE